MKKKILTIKAFVMFALAAVSAGPAFAQNQDDTLKKVAMVKQYIELSKTNEHHKLLAGLNGEWTFIGRHISPDTTKKPFEFRGTVTRKSLWEDRYFITETTSDGKLKMPWSEGRLVDYHDMYIEGYDNVKRKFFISHISNESNTGIITMEGNYNPATRTISYEGESVSHFHRDIAPGTMMHFRVLVKFIDSDHLILEQHESIDGKEIITTELKYQRVKR
jgi:hypothetical protein